MRAQPLQSAVRTDARNNNDAVGVNERCDFASLNFPNLRELGSQAA